MHHSSRKYVRRFAAWSLRATGSHETLSRMFDEVQLARIIDAAMASVSGGHTRIRGASFLIWLLTPPDQ